MFGEDDVRKVLGHEEEHGDEEEHGPDMPEHLIEKAEAVLDVLDPYGSPGPEKEPDEDETPLQRQQRLIDRRANQERRRAKAELLAEVLHDFWEACEEMPHEEAGEREERAGEE